MVGKLNDPAATRLTSDSLIIPIMVTIPAGIVRSIQRPASHQKVVPPFNGWATRPKSLGPTPLYDLPFHSLSSQDIATPVQFEPENPTLRPGSRQLLDDLRAEADGRPVAPRAAFKEFSKEEVDALRSVFGGSIDGAKALLDHLKVEGHIALPPGVTRALLQRYAKVAETAIANGTDKLGVQALRLEALRLIMEYAPP